jgi:outer membrane protein
MGSDDGEAKFVPTVDLQYKKFFATINSPLNPAREGLGYNFLENESWSIGPSVVLDQGRDAQGYIKGIGDVEPTAMAGGFVEGRAGKFFARGQLHTDVMGENDGTRADLKAGIRGKLAEKWQASAMVETNYGTDNYNESYFGVSSNQAAASTNGLAAYNADGGFYKAGLSGQVNYALTPEIYVQGTAGVDKLLDAAKDSTATQDDTQFKVGTGVGVMF